MTYELWDQGTGNRIEGSEEFPKLAEIVRQIAELQGLEAVDDLFVEIWTAFDVPEPVATLRGPDLLRLVQPLVKTYALELDGPPPTPTKTRTSQSTVGLVMAV